MLAGQNGIPYGKFANAEDRAEIRAASGAGASAYSTASPLPAPQSRAKPTPKAAKPTRNNSIFVVHGRDGNLTEDMYLFLRSIDLNPIEWNEAIKGAKGGANPIVGDVIDQAMKKAQGIMVLLSPDEDAKLKNTFATPRDKKTGLNKLDGQPRPNVIFEAGLALGAHSDKTILVQVGDIRDISDIAGKHMAHLTNKPASRKALAMRLRDKLKFKINIDGDHWLEVGDFDR
jgi:predicted nucleotide-binding protein